jgi:hypothetical protein
VTTNRRSAGQRDKNTLVKFPADLYREVSLETVGLYGWLIEHDWESFDADRIADHPSIADDAAVLETTLAELLAFGLIEGGAA